MKQLRFTMDQINRLTAALKDQIERMRVEAEELEKQGEPYGSVLLEKDEYQYVLQSIVTQIGGIDMNQSAENVETTDGLPVKILVATTRYSENYPFLGLVKKPSGIEELVEFMHNGIGRYVHDHNAVIQLRRRK